MNTAKAIKKMPTMKMYQLNELGIYWTGDSNKPCFEVSVQTPFAAFFVLKFKKSNTQEVITISEPSIKIIQSNRFNFLLK